MQSVYMSPQTTYQNGGSWNGKYQSQQPTGISPDYAYQQLFDILRNMVQQGVNAGHIHPEAAQRFLAVHNPANRNNPSMAQNVQSSLISLGNMIETSLNQQGMSLKTLSSIPVQNVGQALNYYLNNQVNIIHHQMNIQRNMNGQLVQHYSFQNGHNQSGWNNGPVNNGPMPGVMSGPGQNQSRPIGFEAPGQGGADQTSYTPTYTPQTPQNGPTMQQQPSQIQPQATMTQPT